MRRSLVGAPRRRCGILTVAPHFGRAAPSEDNGRAQSFDPYQSTAHRSNRPCATPHVAPELLLVIWGVCFVANRSESTAYRGRDFTQPIQVGIDIAGIMTRSSTQPMTSSAEGCDGEPPDRSTQWRSRQEIPGQRTRDIPPVSDDLAGGKADAICIGT